MYVIQYWQASWGDRDSPFRQPASIELLSIAEML